MKLALVLFKEDGTKREHVVSGDRVLIGRTDDADLQAPSKAVSRKHCEIRINGDAATLRDLGSSNGTYHNETLAEGEVALSPGDRIGVGPFVFTVQIDGDPAHIEPPLLEPPKAKPAPPKPAPEPTTEKKSPSDSDADLSDLIASMDEDGSSAFEFNLDDSDI
ncbi:MAG: FHA domain-containing protein [Phycisphaerales bacterium]